MEAVLQKDGLRLKVSGYVEKVLEILVTDLSAIGIGEDHFAAGLHYGGQELRGEVVRETDREMYQVAWYSPHRQKWLDMYESGEA